MSITSNPACDVLVSINWSHLYFLITFYEVMSIKHKVGCLVIHPFYLCSNQVSSIQLICRCEWSFLDELKHFHYRQIQAAATSCDAFPFIPVKTLCRLSLCCHGYGNYTKRFKKWLPSHIKHCRWHKWFTLPTLSKCMHVI